MSARTVVIGIDSEKPTMATTRLVNNTCRPVALGDKHPELAALADREALRSSQIGDTKYVAVPLATFIQICEQLTSTCAVAPIPFEALRDSVRARTPDDIGTSMKVGSNEIPSGVVASVRALVQMVEPEHCCCTPCQCGNCQ